MQVYISFSQFSLELDYLVKVLSQHYLTVSATNTWIILRAHRWGWGIVVYSSRPGQRQTGVLSTSTEELSKLFLQSSVFCTEQGSRRSHQFTGSEILMYLITAAASLGASCGTELFLLC